MSQIHTANFSITSGPGTSLQYDWTYNARSCGRVPTDFDLSIVCVGSGGWGGYIESAGADFAATEKCCPYNGGKNMYRVQYGCVSVECFTNDTALALRFNECYKDAVVAQADKLRRLNSTSVKKEVTRDNANAICEYIDYAWLKKGLFRNVTSTSGGVSSSAVGLVLWAAVIGSMAVAVLSWASL